MLGPACLAIQQQGTAGDETGSYQQLPAGQRRRGDRPGEALHEHRPQRPGDGGAQDGQNAQGRCGYRLQLGNDKYRKTGETKEETKDPIGVQSLLQEKDRKDRSPERHGEGENRSPAGVHQGQGIGCENLPADDVKAGAKKKRQKLLPRNTKGRTVGAGEPQGDRRAADQAGGTKVPDGHHRDRKLHRRPVEAPAEAERKEQQIAGSVAVQIGGGAPRRQTHGTPFSRSAARRSSSVLRSRRFSSAVMIGQSRISSSVRRQPMQWVLALFTWQII